MSNVLARLSSAIDDRYRVVREIGVGGMASVYLAHDRRHERDVAIKVLHPELAAALGAERFLAEIKTTAKLQHPHILPLLDSGEADGLLFYVMPYVAGESLRTRLERETQLSVDDAVRIAREVASALESAHKHGIIHRDIKPENILLHEEQALVADFGIALAVSAAGGARMTQTGLSLGTPAYMAPEQAMGERVIDGRADIYALGAVLYEMLVGEAPFTGPSVQAIVARVMTEQPRAITGQRKSVSAHVNAAVLKALEKLPADRFHTAAEMSRALVTPGIETSRHVAETRQEPGKQWRIGSSAIIPWTIAGLALIAAAALAVRAASRPVSRPFHASVEMPPGRELATSSDAVIGMNSDGTQLTVTVTGSQGRQLLIRNLVTDESRIVQGSAGAIGSAEFSPDGRWIAFNADEKLFKAPVSGGPPTALAATQWGQIAWAGNEAIIFTKSYNTGLFRISAEGKDSSTLTTPDRGKGELGHWWPQVLPDGEHVMFTAYQTPADKSRIEVVSLRTLERRVVLEGGYFGRVSGGRLLFVRGETVMTVPFDKRALTTKGNAAPVGLAIATIPSNGWAGVALSSNGTLAYLSAADDRVNLKWMDEQGNEETAVPETARYFDAVPSPVGRQIAIIRDGDVYVYDPDRQLFSRLTRTEQREISPVWSPDGREIYYARDVPQYDIFKRAVDGSTPEVVVVTSAVDKLPTAVTRAGKVIYNVDDEENDIFQVTVDGAGRAAPQRLISRDGNQDDAVISPDNEWVAYVSNESGQNEVYLAPYPLDRGPARQQVSVDGGDFVLWALDGRALYYRKQTALHRVRVDLRSGQVGKPEPLPRVPISVSWAPAPNGRFLIGKPAENAPRRAVKVVLNWSAALDSTR
jgi:serine/threonine-protein kinase